MTDTICIYHANCIDGFGAAYAVHRSLDAPYDTTFYAAAYGTPAPDTRDMDVVMVDFCYDRETMERIAAESASLTVLDHHKTSAAAMQGFPKNEKTTVLFDMSRSGAGLAWDHLVWRFERPPLIDHIEDRDLWRFELEGTREIHAAVSSYPKDFTVWHELMQKDPAELIKEGTGILRAQMKDLQDLIDSAAHLREFSGHPNIPVLNCPPMWASEAGNILAPGNPFAVTYYDSAGYRHYSLRSTSEGLDVSEIAAKQGGGGHRNAAGMRVTSGGALLP